MIGQHRHRVTLTGAHGSLILTTFEDGASDDGLEVWVTDLQGWDGGTGVEAAECPTQDWARHALLPGAPYRPHPHSQGNHHREGPANSRTRLPVHLIPPLGR